MSDTIIPAQDELGDGDQATEPIQNSELGEESKDKKSDTREYIVFQEGNSGNWAEVGKAVAGNAGQAILAMKDPKEGVRYAAVPTRNWTRAKTKVKVETTVQLEFE